jgi:Arc/MetJ-type ribon-helix-helix transcriptional regulator
MSYAFPAELQQLVQSELAKGVHASEDELLILALKALGEREQIFQQLRAEVQCRIESLERGEGIELEDAQALREFADEIKAEGRRSWEANRDSIA